MARETRKQIRRRRIVQRIILGSMAFTVALISFLAWSWHRSVPMKRVVVTGAVHADSSEVVRFAALDRDSVGLFAVESDVLVDRVRRTPWVRNAVVRRRPTGTLSIRVEEREPVVLVVQADGRPSHYLDAEGYAMPLVPNALYDVPLLRGRVPETSATQPIQTAFVRELLEALANADLETNALISEIILGSGGNAVLHTSPAGGHGSVPAYLGVGNYEEKLERLHAFWHQAVLTRPNQIFRTIDVRFDGQIVTREDSTTTSN